ncbi:MBL fold metallo-hydrolase [Arthrobacter sp. I2-34]|uniref:MBL fold metallo-hydrolase n=1 Tax=Arthrobacter hankyongi TaxID=2904801 RepID=A0ABS9L6B3_9MICC|nr:MBL fold metallo-hydrolase [Arthrobacter hankyongi]MCG2622161.1 MBL fold metallo-hydrolase [Arthrobacter hankyongi]
MQTAAKTFLRSSSMGPSPFLARRHTPWHESTAVTEPAEGVFFVEGPASNWIIAREGQDFTLIDGGYPADLPRVLDSIRHTGLRPERAAAMLITHGHVDHTGSAAWFSAEYGTPVLCSPGEYRQLLGEEKYQVSPGQVILRAWRPRVFNWLVHVLQAGGLQENDIPDAGIWDIARLAGLPGAPVAVPTPGHSPGHAAYRLPGAGAVATGDALVTGHAISPAAGPQMLHPMFHHDIEAAYRALEALAAVPERLVLPGHGPSMTLDLAAASAALRR